MPAEDERLQRACMEAMGLRAVYATVAPASGRLRFGASADPDAARTALRQGNIRAGVAVAGWCTIDHAELLLAVLRDRRRQWPADLPSAVNFAVDAAQQLGLQLLSDLQFRERAAAVAHRVGQVFEAQLRAGELRDLNRRYKTDRLARAADGRRFPPYRAWLRSQKLALIRATAVHAAKLEC